MTAKVSSEMLRAMELVRAGSTPYAAAKVAGISASAISQSRLYHAYKLEKEIENAKAPRAE